MHLFNHTKLFLLLLISVISINGSIAPTPKTECSFGKSWEWPVTWQFPPLKQPNNLILNQKRNNIRTYGSMEPENFLKEFPSSALISIAATGERPGVCYNDAMRRTLGLSQEQFKQLEQSILGCEDWVTILGMPYDFFNQTNKQKAGYLTTYTSEDNDFHIRHFGEVIRENRIRSKFGTSDYTYDHDLWHLPIHWGNRIRFWKLQKIYRSNEGKALLFDILKKRIESSVAIQEARHSKKQELLNSRNYLTSYALLKGITGLPIDVRNNDGKTPLMIAAEKNSFRLVELYVEHHANLNLQDASGNTALKLAADNSHNRIVDFLLEQGADPFIQDNNGNTANISFAKIYHKHLSYGTMTTLSAIIGYYLY